MEPRNHVQSIPLEWTISAFITNGVRHVIPHNEIYKSDCMSFGSADMYSGFVETVNKLHYTCQLQTTSSLINPLKASSGQFSHLF